MVAVQFRKIGNRARNPGSLGHGCSPWLGLGPSRCYEHLGGPLDFYSQCLYIVKIDKSRQCLYMPTSRIKTAQVNLRIEPKLKKAAEQAAADDQRSLTSLVEKLLTDYLRKKGT
jgi:hypothetical protein